MTKMYGIHRNRKQQGKSPMLMWLFEKINKFGKCLIRLMKEKRKHELPCKE